MLNAHQFDSLVEANQEGGLKIRGYLKFGEFWVFYQLWDLKNCLFKLYFTIVRTKSLLSLKISGSLAGP